MNANDYRVTFNPETGTVHLRAPYDGNRHNDRWIEHRLKAHTVNGGEITYWAYEDGQFISLEMKVPYAGLVLEALGEPRPIFD